MADDWLAPTGKSALLFFDFDVPLDSIGFRRSRFVATLFVSFRFSLSFYLPLFNHFRRSFGSASR